MYQPNPEIKKLRAEQNKIHAELEQLQHQNQRLKNRIAYLNKGERTKRAHRLITRGAARKHCPGSQAYGRAQLLCTHGRNSSAPGYCSPHSPQHIREWR